MGQKQITLQASGLYTYPNNLSRVPSGALLIANNTILDKPGVIEPRRGIKYYGNKFSEATDRAKQLLQYRDRLILHINNTLAYDDNNGNLSYFFGTYNSASEYRIKSTSARGNFYFTTDNGVMRISAQNANEFTTESGFIRSAGIPFPIQPTAQINTSVTGFLGVGLQCGYKVVFGYRDNNNNDLLGSPSSALVITNNTATPNVGIDLTFKLPSQINSQQNYYRVYRTQGTEVADDLYRLVYQGAINSNDINLGQITYTDKLSDESWYSGITLYTNSTDEGPLASNDPPPFSEDIATYSNHTFYSNTRQQHQILLSLQSTSSFTANSSTITFTDGSITSTYTYVNTSENITLKHVLISNDPNPTIAANETARSLVRVINAQNDEFFNASFLPAGAADIITGNVLIRKKDYSTTPIYIGSLDLTTVSSYSPEINKIFTNIVSTGASATINTTVNHDFISKSNVFIFGADTVKSINGLQRISNLTANTFQIPIEVTSIILNGYTMTTNYASNNYDFGNRLYYSKYNQPESVPFGNYFDIGSKDKPIKRIVALRESLFIFKQDGIYRLTGDSISNFSVALFDNTNIIVAPDTAVVLDNQIFVFTTQGIIKLSEVGFEVISLPIKEKFIPYITSNPNISTLPFGVSYQTDRAYLVWTVSSKLDTYPTVCYRYSLSTGCWTEWQEPKTCGIVLSEIDKLFLGSAIDSTLEVERKDFNRFDYSDREIPSALVPFSLSDKVIKPSVFDELSVEDVISQTQYVTIYQYNLLLIKIDLDTFTLNKNFYSSLEMNPGDSLEQKMISLVDALNIRDPSGFVDSNGNTSYVFIPTSDFANIQVQYNKIIDRLNQSAAFAYNNYNYSQGTIMLEAIVVSLDTIFKKATLSISPEFMQGPLLFYKGIKTIIEYAPQTAGDPAQLKQFYQGTWMFAYRSFYSAQVGYTSDLSLAYENVNFYPFSSGVWGQFSWGDGAVWGGLGDRVQLRTYIPTNKQRARFLTCRFEHGIALESYESYGVSISYNDNSDRAYR
jgi:hypothetical protein